MAWQLIYTSAPRSLEAGRSGFGTVARHRSISPLLVTAIERASQFSRVSGADAGRVIFSHRIIAVAGGRFHVLSAIRDAGADYTGRTNHIAHHLVVDPREVAQLGTDGVSPADVLLAMPWTTSWDEAPRFLEAGDEVEIAQFHPRSGSSAWAKITGQAEQAWLLASGEASRGAYLVYPENIDLREIYAESLRLMPERLWQVTFTSSLQSSDEPADFRWIGIEERSPLRAQGDSSGRRVLDLTQPASLPQIEVVQPPARSQPEPAPLATPPPHPTAPSLRPETATPSAATSAALPRPSPTSARGAPSVAPRKSLEVTGAVAPRRTPEFRPPIQKKRGMTAAIFASVVVISLLVFGFLTYSKHQHRLTVENEIDGILKSDSFFSVGSGRRIREELKKTDYAQLEIARKLAQSAIRSLGTVRNADFEAMRLLPDDSVRQMARSANLNVPIDLNTFDGKLKEIGDDYDRLNNFPAKAAGAKDPDAALKQLDDWRKAGKDQTDRALQDAEVADTNRIKTAFDVVASKQRVATVLALLNGDSGGKMKGPKPYDWYRDALQAKWFGNLDLQTPPQQNDSAMLAEAKQDLEKAQKLLADWKFVEEQTTRREIAEVNARIKKSGAGWPEWLRRMAEQIVGLDPGSATGATAGTESPAPLPAPGKTDQPPVAGGSPGIYFFAANKGLSVPLPPNYEKLKFFLTQKGQAEEEQTPYGGSLERFGPDGKVFKVSNGILEPGGAALAPPYEVSVRTQNAAELLRAYVGNPGPNLPILADKSLTLKREDHLIKIIGDLSNIKAKLVLVTPVNFTGGTKAQTLDVSPVLDCELESILASLNKPVAGSAKEPAPPAAHDSAEAKAEGIRHRAEQVTLKQISEKFKTPDNRTGAELVGDFATSLAPLLKDKKSDELLAAGTALHDAKPEEWKARNNDLKSKLSELQQPSGQERIDAVAALRDLCGKLDQLIEVVAAQQARLAAQTKQAEAAQAKARNIQSLPLLAGKLPPGSYALKLKDMDVTLYTFNVTE